MRLILYGNSKQIFDIPRLKSFAGFAADPVLLEYKILSLLCLLSIYFGQWDYGQVRIPIPARVSFPRFNRQMLIEMPTKTS